MYDLADLCMIMEHSCRQTGRTTALAKAVNEIDGSLMVHSVDFGRQLQKTHPSLKIVLPNNSICGSSKPILMDHFYIFTLATQMKNKYEKEILDLKIEIERLKEGATIQNV